MERTASGDPSMRLAPAGPTPYDGADGHSLTFRTRARGESDPHLGRGRRRRDDPLRLPHDISRQGGTRCFEGLAQHALRRETVGALRETRLLSARNSVAGSTRPLAFGASNNTTNPIGIELQVSAAMELIEEVLRTEPDLQGRFHQGRNRWKPPEGNCKTEPGCWSDASLPVDRPSMRWPIRAAVNHRGGPAS